MARFQVDKIKELISHLKSNTGKLASEGVNEQELKKHVATLETEVNKPQPNHGALEEALASLEITVEKAEESLAMSGVFRLLNTIFGTGVPEPPGR